MDTIILQRGVVMSYKIVVDSCCELPEEFKNDPRFERVPLALEVGDYHTLDDETFDQKDFLKKSYSLTNKTRAIERLETAKAINVPWNDKYGTKRQFNTTFKTKPAKCATIIDVVLF